MVARDALMEYSPAAIAMTVAIALPWTANQA